MRDVILVGGFLGGLACFVAGAYVAFGTGAALVVAGFVLLFLSYVASLGSQDEEDEDGVEEADDDSEYKFAVEDDEGTDTP